MPTAFITSVEVDGKAFKSLTAGLEAIAAGFEQGLKRAGPPLAKALSRALQLSHDDMKRRHGSAWPAGTVAHSNPDLFRRSGGGLKSIARSIKVRGKDIDALQGLIGAGFPIAVHEKGGTLKPKSAQYLTIPLPAAMDGRGIPIKKKARDWENSFVGRSKQGNLLIFQRRGREIVPLYLLKKSVTLRPRLGLGTAVKTITLPFFEQRALDVIGKELDRRL